MADKTNIYGWTGSAWVPLLANAAGKLIIDPSEILEEPPTDGQMGKAATSNWSHDHAANASAHHVRYSDAEAIAAAKTDSTLLNYTQGARVYNSGVETIPTDAWTTLGFDSERYDTDNIHDPSIFTMHKLTCKTAGKYILTGHIRFDANAVGDRLVGIRLNAGNFLAIQNVPPMAANQPSLSVATLYDLAVNDSVTLCAYQSSGGHPFGSA